MFVARRKSPLAVRVGKRIRAARERRDWSQRQLAVALDVAEKQVSGYENGWHMPGLARLERIAELLGVSAEALMFGSPELGDDEDEDDQAA
jgi:transcriptional regulator with XRE-family HTH domain